MKKSEFESFFKAFFNSLFDLWIQRVNFPKSCDLTNQAGMPKIYDFPIRDRDEEQQNRGRDAVEQQRNNFRTYNQLSVLRSSDGYIVVNLSNPEKSEEVRYLAIKIEPKESNPYLKVTGLNFPDHNRKYRSGCSANDLVFFMEKTNPQKIPQSWQVSDRKDKMNSEFLNSNNYKINDPNRALNPELIRKEEQPLARNANYAFYFPLYNNLSNQDELKVNLKKYETIQFRRKTYVNRSLLEKQAKSKLFDVNVRAIRMSAPKKMGKRMLLQNILIPEISKRKYQIITINCSEGSVYLDDFNQYSKWFITQLSLPIIRRIDNDNTSDINTEIEADVEKKLSQSVNNEKVNTFLEEYFLPQARKKFVIILDDFDVILERDNLRVNFIPLLRGWWENSKNNKGNWQKLHLVLVNSSEVYAVKGDKFSPDIGYPLASYFRDFYKEGEIPELISILQENRRVELSLEKPLIEKIVDLVGGSPYLLSEILTEFKTQETILKNEFSTEEILDNILQKSVTSEGIYQQHFNELLAALENDQGMKDYFITILESEPRGLMPPYHFQLKSLGLIKPIEGGNHFEVRNKLYREFFSSIYLL